MLEENPDQISLSDVSEVAVEEWINFHNFPQIFEFSGEVGMFRELMELAIRVCDIELFANCALVSDSSG